MANVALGTSVLLGHGVEPLTAGITFYFLPFVHFSRMVKYTSVTIKQLGEKKKMFAN